MNWELLSSVSEQGQMKGLTALALISLLLRLTRVETSRTCWLPEWSNDMVYSHKQFVFKTPWVMVILPSLRLRGLKFRFFVDKWFCLFVISSPMKEN